MNILREIIRFLTSFKSYSIKRLLWLFFALTIGFSLFGFSFVSCAPGIDEQASGDGDDGDEETTPRRRRDDEDDDEDDGDKCRGNESCERVCEAIYEDYSEKTNCMDEGELQVGRLEKVYNLLMKEGRDADDVESDLQELSAGEEDVDINHFEDYLKIGSAEWIRAIKAGLGNGDNNSNLIELLKWFVKDKEVAEIISEVDDGKKVLEELLLKMSSNLGNTSTDCMRGSSASGGSNGGDVVGLWAINIVDHELNIAYYSGSGSGPTVGDILLKSKHTELYDALSCMYSDIKSGNHNIFSVAENENNQVLFDMAFDLLDEVCEDLYKNPTHEEDVACRRALLCWTAEQRESTSESGFVGRDFVENKSSELSTSESGYNNCRADAFADFF